MITSVMYHYVRPIEKTQLRYLSTEDFEKQLDWLENSIAPFLTAEQWEMSKKGKDLDGVLLTFDDGLKDHIKYVLPILEKRGLFAIFFVSSSPLSTNSMLAVHLTHKLLSIGESQEILEFFYERLPSDIWLKLNVNHAAKAYEKHRDLEDNVKIKKVVNYLFADYDLAGLLEAASKTFLSGSMQEISKSWYLSKDDLKVISKAGMKIGSHACTHRLLSLLDEKEIHYELSHSRDALEEILDIKVDEFCYPYGGSHSYSPFVKRKLLELGYQVAHDVYPKQISKADFEARFALPRFNCNELPFGTAYSLK